MLASAFVCGPDGQKVTGAGGAPTRCGAGEWHFPSLGGIVQRIASQHIADNNENPLSVRRRIGERNPLPAQETRLFPAAGSGCHIQCFQLVAVISGTSTRSASP